MTVNTTTITSGPYTATGGQTIFDYTFRADVEADLDVYVNEILRADYTVSGLGDDDGGQIEFIAGLTAGDKVYIRSSREATQDTEFSSQGGFYPEEHERAFDKLTYLIQQLGDKIKRTLRIADTKSELATLDLVAGKFVQVNATADGFQMADRPVEEVLNDAVVNTVADLAFTVVVPGAVYNLKEYYAGGGGGGGQLLAYTSTDTPNNGTIFASGTAGVRLKRINYFYLTPDDFGAVGVTHAVTAVDVTARINAMIDWINYGGTRHVIFPPLKYGISAPLNQIVRSSVTFEGSGTLSSQDGGITEEHTLFQWIGGSAPGDRMFFIAPVSSLSSARLDGITFTGINIDCSEGLGIGLAMQSCRNTYIDIFVKNPTYQGMQMGVVALLGEAKDCRDNRIRYTCRALESGAHGANGLVLTGDGTANTCFNLFEKVAISAYNATPVIVSDADNNLWLDVAVGKAAGGSASYSMDFLGTNAVHASVSRSEQIFKLSSNLPAIIRGTTSYTYPSKNIKFYNLDKENGCPDPVIETGASAYYQYDDTAMYPGKWTAYTPVVTPGTGTLTAYTATGRYMRVPGGVHFSVIITITTNGTAASFLTVTLPMQAGPSITGVAHGWENSTGFMVTGQISTNATTMGVVRTAGGYPGANGYTLNLSGFYEKPN